MREKLRELLRVSRFQGWDYRRLEAEILKLFGEGVEDQPATTPDQ